MSVRRSGLTLLELVAVLVILTALAAVIVPLVGRHGDEARQVVTAANLRQLSDVLLNKYRPDMGSLSRATTADPPQMRYLFLNPTTGNANQTFDPFSALGWRGPYLVPGGATYRIDNTAGFTATYGNAGDPTPIDGWGRPIVLQEAAGVFTLRSAGPNGVLNDADDLTLTLPAN